MRRRSFLSLSGAAASASSLEAVQRARTSAAGGGRPVKIHAGCQRGPTNEKLLQHLKRHGVDACCGYPPDPGERGYWTVEDLEKTRDLYEKHGVKLEMVALPWLASSHIDREKRPAIMLADSPQRDRDIENSQKMIAHMAKAGIPAFKYNMSILGVLRSGRTPGRGGAMYSTWRFKEAKPPTPLTRAGRVDADRFWERITYFLDRIIPACNEHKVRAACHPHDPGVPPEGYQGVVRVLGTPDGLKKFITIQESPYHGLNLCLGTTAEMLQDPHREIHDVIRYFGARKKIFNIHFRNIVGKRDDFYEVYPDNGDMNMVEVARTLYEVDYPYMLMPDHMPQHADDPGGWQAFAFGYGYIKAVIQSLETLLGSGRYSSAP